MRKNIKGNRGITLIALVITIIILLILVGIIIKMLFNNNGIIDRTVESRFKTHIASVEEKTKLYITDKEIEENIKNIKYEKLEKLPIKGEKVTSTEDFKDTLIQEIKNITKKENIADSNIYFIDKSKIQIDLKHDYLIDIDSFQIYDVEGEKFFGEYHHVLNSMKNGKNEDEEKVINNPELVKAKISFNLNPDRWTKDTVVATAEADASIITKGWSEISKGEYTFEKIDNKWVSNNKGIDYSTATTTWSMQLEKAEEYEIKYKVSSEKNYDKLTILLDGQTIVNNISGDGTEETYKVILDEGTHTIVATYSKDSSSASNDDCAYIILEEQTESINYIIETSIDGVNWENKTQQTYEQNGLVYARLKVGNTIIASTTSNIDIIDKEAPEILELIQKSDCITIDAEDKMSGICGYVVKTAQTVPNEDEFIEIENINHLNKNITGLEQNTIYYVWIKDLAGNVSEATSIKTGVGLGISYNPIGWTNESVIATAAIEKNWQEESNGTYSFINKGEMWISNNKGINYSTATTTWEIQVDSNIEYEIKYKVSSEKNYDKLTILLDGQTIVENISGNGTEQSYKATLNEGTHTIVATYSKDSSSASYDDCAYLILKPIITTANNNYIIQTSKDGENWEDNTSQKYIENGIIYARILKEGNVIEVTTGNIDKIDKVAPVINNVTSTTSEITIEATDDISGISGYLVTTSSEVPNLEDFESCNINTSFNRTITNKIQETTYYVWVRDEAGNISEFKNTTTGKVKDLTEANVTFSYQPSGWTNGNVVATASTTITGFTIQTSSDGINWVNSSRKSFSENGIIYARLTDGTNVGGATTGNVDKIDKIEPTANITLNKPILNLSESNSTSAKVVLSDEGGSDINFERCKYVLNKESREIGKNESLYTDGIIDSYTKNIEFTISDLGEYYLHVLVADNAGNLKEIISNKIASVNKLASCVEIGDYVQYHATEESYTSPVSKNGYADQIFNSHPDNLWRVFSKNEETGEVVLISRKHIYANDEWNKSMWFKGIVGYNYFEEELNKICSIFGHGVGANTDKTFNYKIGGLRMEETIGTMTGSGARCLNANDINNITGYVPEDDSVPYEFDISECLGGSSPYIKMFADADDATGTRMVWLANRSNRSITTNDEHNENWFGAQMSKNGTDNNLYGYKLYNGARSMFSITSFTDYYRELEIDTFANIYPIVYLKPTVMTSGTTFDGVRVSWTLIE